jgi:hypothetical protein
MYDCDSANFWSDLLQGFKQFGCHCIFVIGEACDISAWMCEASYYALTDRVGDGDKYDRHSLGLLS